MALTEKSRHAIYEGLSGVIRNEQAVEEMLSYFPARDIDEPLTRDYLDARLTDEFAAFRIEFNDALHNLETSLRSEIAQLRMEMADIRAEMTGVEAGIRADMANMEAGIRGDMAAEFAQVRAEMTSMEKNLRADISNLDVKVTELRVDLHATVVSQTRWIVATMTALGGLFMAISQIF